ncbi:aminoglycoside phosphotransferase family protein [Knoellia locipacati]|uniref:phosphotransferase n=1 Tax=Knoellia locipacati TaxID=882824 RepID=UPI00384A5AE8
MLSTGLSAFPKEPDDVVIWVERHVEALLALPEDDPRRPSPAEAEGIESGLPLVRDAAAALVDSGLPDSLQHNDLHLGNAFRRGEGAALIDLGDALWTHPLTSARIPMWIVRNRLQLAVDHPDLVRVAEAFIEPWTDLADRESLHALLPAADRISCLHRAESWRRLIADVPLSRVDDDFVRAATEWLVDATAADPFASAVDR